MEVRMHLLTAAAIVAVRARRAQFAITVQSATVAGRVDSDVIAHAAWRRAEVHDALAATAAVVACACVN